MTICAACQSGRHNHDTTGCTRITIGGYCHLIRKWTRS